MFNNTFGNLLRLTTFGESHGPASGASLTASRQASPSTPPSSKANWTAAAPDRAA